MVSSFYCHWAETQGQSVGSAETVRRRIRLTVPGPPRMCQGGTRGNLPYFLGLTEACRVRKIFPYERQPYLLEELNLPLIATTGKKFIFDNYNVEFTRYLESL